MITFILIILFILVFLLILNFINLLFINKICPDITYQPGKTVSVLIPARNEEYNIGECIRSVLDQTFSPSEIIILNDNSTDNTSGVVNSFNSDKIREITGKSLPEGWVGKNFACHQLQAAAKSDYLLFLDADTVLDSGCIASAVRFAEVNKCGLLSVMPFEVAVTFWEKIVIPMLYFALMVFLPVPLIEKSRRKQFAVANGQFMLFKKECYNLIGGHESLKNRIVEDVWLSKRVKEFGQKLLFVDGTDIVKCRMYKNSEEVWGGFSKNFFAGLSFSGSGLIVIILLYFILFILPAILLCFGLINNNIELVIYSIISVLIPVIIRITHSLKFRQPFWFSFLNIISSGYIIAVALNSFRILKFGKGANWKGRNYKESVIK